MYSSAKSLASQHISILGRERQLVHTFLTDYTHSPYCRRQYLGWEPPAPPPPLPQWGAAAAEIKVPSGENTELKRSPFKAWSRSVYNHTSQAYCQGFLPCLFLPFRSIHSPAFFPNLSQVFLCWLWLTHGSCVDLQNKIGHPARDRFPCWVPTEYK